MVAMLVAPKVQMTAETTAVSRVAMLVEWLVVLKAEM